MTADLGAKPHERLLLADDTFFQEPLLDILMKALVFVLGLGLISAAIWFIIYGMRQNRRRRRLTLLGGELGLRYSFEDPFDLISHVPGIALFTMGHGARATHVIYGRLSGKIIRAFEFRYEAGHGPQRSIRRYDMILFEFQSGLQADTLLWPQEDLSRSPLSMRQADGQVKTWSFRGNSEMAARLAGLASEPLEQAAIQISGDWLAIAWPVEPVHRDLPWGQWLEAGVDLAGRLEPELSPKTALELEKNSLLS